MEADGRDRFTAHHFLKFMKEMRAVVLQDLAATAVLYPSRKKHLVFSLALFQTQEWYEYVEKMKEALATESNPTNFTLEAVLPGVNNRLEAEC